MSSIDLSQQQLIRYSVSQHTLRSFTFYKPIASTWRFADNTTVLSSGNSVYGPGSAGTFDGPDGYVQLHFCDIIFIRLLEILG